MSGGRFQYDQAKILEIAEQIEGLIYENKRDEYPFSSKTIAKFRQAVRHLKIAYVYAQRVDWLVSGDDGEESFTERLKQELDELARRGD